MHETKRMSISISSEIDEAIITLKKTDQFCRSSYSEIVREILKTGMSQMRTATSSMSEQA